MVEEPTTLIDDPKKVKRGGRYSSQQCKNLGWESLGRWEKAVVSSVRTVSFYTDPKLTQIDAGSGGETVTYLHNDHLLTNRLGTNQSGQVAWRWEGEAFGSEEPEEDFDGDGDTVQVNLRFPGQYRDGETGWFYNWMRYYDPEIGRYITSDPTGLWGGINTYAYVGGNPLQWLDPYGFARVHIWTPGTYRDSSGNIYVSDYGHASIESNSGQYLSHHPRKSGWNYFGSKFRTKAEDNLLYGRSADFVYDIKLSNEEKLDKYINEYKGDEAFWGFYGNCADAVSGGIRSGGHSSPDFSDGWFDFISYPLELRNYLQRLDTTGNR